MNLSYEAMDGSLPDTSAGAHSASAPYSAAITAGTVLAADILTIILAGMAVYVCLGGGWANYRDYLSVSAVAGAVVAATFGYLKLYDFDALTKPTSKWRKIVIACGLSFFLLYLSMLSVSALHFYPASWRYGFLAVSVIAIWAERGVVYAIIFNLAKRGLVSRNIVIIGAGEQGVRLMRSLQRTRQPWTRILGVFDDRMTRIPATVEGFPWLGTTRNLINFSRDVRVDDIFVALPWTAESRVMEVLDSVRVIPANVHLSPDLMGHMFLNHKFVWREGICVLNLASKPLDGWGSVVKAIEDKAVALLALFFLLPIFLVTAIAIKLDSPGPILFRQMRYAFNNKLFQVYKFRTMYQEKTDANAETLATKHDPRVTRIGRFLRRSSIDELPQFLNVLKGDMSIVGPRPHAVMAKAGGKLYADAVVKYAERHKVKPGITGWAQVNGWRGETDTEEKIRRRVECDIYYMENWSLFLDLQIILRTLLVVLPGEGAY